MELKYRLLIGIVVLVVISGIVSSFSGGGDEEQKKLDADRGNDSGSAAASSSSSSSSASSFCRGAPADAARAKSGEGHIGGRFRLTGSSFTSPSLAPSTPTLPF